MIGCGYATFFLHLHTHTHVMLRWGGVGWLITFKYTSTHTRHATLLRVLLAHAHTHTSYYATARSSCTCTQTSCYVGVGWGGLRSRLGKEVGHPLHSPLACIWLKYFRRKFRSQTSDNMDR